MKWNKYQQQTAQYPWLNQVLGFNFWNHWAHKTAKEIVKKHVGYIAFRPFASLDMKATTTSTSNILPDARYQHVQMEMYTRCDYSIYATVVGDEHERIKFTDDGTTVEQCIDAYKEWFVKCDVFKDRRLLLTRVIKRTISGSSYTGLTNVNFEIYEFPIGERVVVHPVQTPEPQIDPYDREVMTAYVSGTPMPPIRPGMQLA